MRNESRFQPSTVCEEGGWLSLDPTRFSRVETSPASTLLPVADGLRFLVMEAMRRGRVKLDSEIRATIF